MAEKNVEMTLARLARREATVLWEGDVVVLGASLAGLNVAVLLAEAGRKVCVLEPGPVLGVEVGELWANTVPPCRISQRVWELCRERGGFRAGRLDIVLATSAFDIATREAEVQAIVRVLPVRPLVDGEKKLRGVEVVGRSGRQAVLAPLVVDATSGRAFTRRAMGLPVLQPITVERRAYICGIDADSFPQPTLINGEKAGPLVIRTIPTVWSGETILAVTMAVEGAVTAAGLALKSYRTVCDTVAHLRRSDARFASATLVDVAPRYVPRFVGESSDFTPCRAAGLVPLPELGTVAAEVEQTINIAQWLPDIASRESLPVPPDEPSELIPGTSELDADPEWDQESAVLPESIVTVHEKSDVVVAGWGTGGSMAALTAAELGVKVTVVDEMSIPGGTGTAGRIHWYYYGLTGGLQDKIDKLVAEREAELAVKVRGFHPSAKADVLLRELEALRVSVFPGHIVFGAVKQGNLVTGILTASEDGYHLFPCDVAIDATGNGDLAAAAGARFTLGREADGFPQPYSYTPTRMADGALTHHNFDAGWVLPCDTLDYSRAHFEGRQRIWHLGPYDQQRHYCSLAWALGVREGRLIEGEVRISFSDFLEGTAYAEAVCDCHAHYDNHSLDYALESDWARRHVVLFGLFEYLTFGQIPFGVLLPADVRGVLIACRALSVDHDGHTLLRMQRDIQKIGEVCGVAAVLACQAKIAPHRLDCTRLRSVLESRGIVATARKDAVLEMSGEELLQSLGSEMTGVAMWRLSTLPADHAPDWSVFFARETDAARRFWAAVAAALGPAPSDEARAVLRETVRQRDMARAFGDGSFPRCVVAALALVEMRDEKAGRLASDLLNAEVFDPLSILLLMRAIAKAGDPVGVSSIREFLHQTETETFTVQLRGGRPTDTESLRFAVELLAVEVLLDLGNRDELPRLTRYVNHEHLLIRKWARRIARAAGSADE
ncbi:MAG: FAD-dependent oxidoreductase [Kiritimatiellae bacterium]|nr:FAD-dependent oxidoreductase [Kiritimatiellia bacterium]